MTTDKTSLPGKRLAPTEVDRKQALLLAQASLGSQWRATTAQAAWDLLGTLIERGAAPHSVAAWYQRASAQITAGQRCHQQFCFEADWRTLVRTGTCPRLSYP